MNQYVMLPCAPCGSEPDQNTCVAAVPHCRKDEMHQHRGQAAVPIDRLLCIRWELR